MQVTLNKKGQIRAHHDDPHAHLMPHNKYQNAEYPDGCVHAKEYHLCFDTCTT